MSDPLNSQLKPQDTIILILGELRGQMSSVLASQAAATASQESVNAENRREHDKFRETLDAHALDINAIKTAQPVKVSFWVKLGTVIAIPSSLVALVGFIILLTK